MKISPQFVLKVAGTLTIIALVTAALLGLVDYVTRDRIDEINAEKTRVALQAVVEDAASDFVPVEIPEAAATAATAQGGTVSELYEVNLNGEAVGYAVKVVASGSQGNIEMVVGVNNDKAITGVSVVSHSETSGIGTKVTGNEPTSDGVGVLDQFKGLSGAGTLVVKGNITPITGATVSTTGVTKGANAALAAVEALG